VHILHSKCLQVVQVAVVAFEDERIDGRPCATDLRVGRNRLADLRLRHGAHGKRVGQRNRRFQHAQLFHLHQADALAEAVEHDAGGRHFVEERVAGVRAYHGHAGLDVAAGNRGVADGDASHVGDAVACAGRQSANVRKAQRHANQLSGDRSSDPAHRAGRRPAG
jgi:hypothetical protein